MIRVNTTAASNSAMFLRMLSQLLGMVVPKEKTRASMRGSSQALNGNA